jgi:hypothetical protein
MIIRVKTNAYTCNDNQFETGFHGFNNVCLRAGHLIGRILHDFHLTKKKEPFLASANFKFLLHLISCNLMSSLI